MRLFLKDNKGYIGVFYFSVFITLAYGKLKDFITMSEGVYILIFNTFILFSFMGFRYYKNKDVYKLFAKEFKSFDEYLSDVGHSFMGDNISKVLRNQHMLYEEKVEEYNKVYNNHLIFVNHWVHQMKTPLSVIQLQLYQHEGEETVESIRDEVGKLNKGLNLAMYFARLSSFEKDFVVEKISLHQLVMDKINEEKKLFIKNKIMPKVEIDKSIIVHSDVKWLKFILEQVATNGVKYSKNKGKHLTFRAVESDKYIKLDIIDQGVGIPKKDIKRVFDLFFTGHNGRKFGESTGMGLYIVKTVCDYLHHEVEIESKVNEGTRVTIVFKK